MNIKKRPYFAEAKKLDELLPKHFCELAKLPIGYATHLKKYAIYCDDGKKIKDSEKEFNRVIFERGVTEPKVFSKIKSLGDQAFFGGNTTQDMKQKLGVKNPKHPLADYTNKAVNLGRALANTMTTMNVEDKDLYGETPITNEHITSNTNVRKAMIDTGIIPEHLPAEEDIKKIENKINKDNKNITKLK